MPHRVFFCLFVARLCEGGSTVSSSWRFDSTNFRLSALRSTPNDFRGSCVGYCLRGRFSLSSDRLFRSLLRIVAYNLTVPVGIRAHIAIPTVPDRGLKILEVREASEVIWSAASTSGNSHAVLGVGAVERRHGLVEEELAVPVVAGHYSFTAYWQRSTY